MAASPSVVASVNGIANHTSPPMIKPPTTERGLAAIARCQYDWSTNTVPKLPTILITPNTRAPADASVR